MQLCKLEESSLIRLFSPNFNSLGEDIEHIHLRIPPESWFLDISMMSSWCKSFQFFGIFPDKLLHKRYIATRPFSFLIDEGMLPFNKLPEKMKDFQA